MRSPIIPMTLSSILSYGNSLLISSATKLQSISSIPSSLRKSSNSLPKWKPSPASSIIRPQGMSRMPSLIKNNINSSNEVKFHQTSLKWVIESVKYYFFILFSFFHPVFQRNIQLLFPIIYKYWVNSPGIK